MFISVSSQTTLLDEDNFFVFALYDATAPTVLLESIQPSKPYGNPLQISFTHNCLNGHIYIIKLWESQDDTPTGVVRNSFSQSVNSNASAVLVKMDEYLEADITPGLVNTATTYVNEDWNGWEYSIERVGQGTMIPDFTDNTNPSYTQDDAGGFHLIQAGDIFAANEKFVVRFIPQVIPNPDDGTPSAIFSAGRIITANETLTNADVGTALQIQSATNKITVTFPALSTVADFSFMYIYSVGGSHINAVFALPGTDKFLYNGGDKAQLILGQSEILKCFKAFGKWNIDNDLNGVKQVGELVFNYSMPEANTIPCNGNVLQRNQYPRLWAWVQTLESGVAVSESAWFSTFITVNGVNYFTKRGCFSTGDGSTTFRVPSIMSYYLRPVDGDVRIPGSFQVQNIQPHTHDDIEGDTASHGSSSSALSGAWKWLVGLTDTGHGTAAGSKTGAVTSIGSNTETTPSNIGVYALIRI